MGSTDWIQRDLKPALRFPLLALGFVALGLGILAGLSRMGWSVPLPSPSVMLLHGPLMVSGFFGTVIGLERAVALGQRWAYAGPLLNGTGGLLLLAGISPLPGALLMSGGAIVLLVATLAAYRRQPAFHTLILALGAACWGVGNLLWSGGWALLFVVPWWMAFLVLTIAGERLELSRFLPPSPLATRLFGGLTLLLMTGTTMTLVATDLAWPVVGASFLAFAAWLLKQDVARRTVRQQGLTRFIAVCLLSGYAWLAIAGLLLLHPATHLGAGPMYDAALHSLFVGFVFAMVFGHAPIIFPAVTQLRVPYHPLFYVPLLVLHISLALRLTGDLMGLDEWRRLGGMANAVALVLFVLNTVSAIVRGKFTTPALAR
ncbi:MAG: hypothetical protein DWQ09_16405 [Proteobacteria bacterium]|nr:MAG: hypothetical protein DWQ09_16405 [Pseudomonadota bacterium]QKK11711.1 MAG: hypothetical protein HND59_09040 [Pseudomonadota bacterium]